MTPRPVFKFSDELEAALSNPQNRSDSIEVSLSNWADAIGKGEPLEPDQLEKYFQSYLNIAYSLRPIKTSSIYMTPNMIDMMRMIGTYLQDRFPDLPNLRANGRELPFNRQLIITLALLRYADK